MTALTEFTHESWRGNSSDASALPLNLIKRSWLTPVHLLTRICQAMSAAIISSIVAALASLRSDRVYTSPLSLAAMIYTTVLWAPLIDLNSVNRLLPEHIAQGLEVVAALWVIAARRTLSRATAKHVGLGSIVDSGAYSLVRHPIYAGRALLYGAFLLSNFNVQNALILLSVYAAQIYRIIIEENHLMKDASYQSYAQKVRYRLIIGVF